jgi:hypothetical protein
VVIVKEKEAYKLWLVQHRNFPRAERFGIGQKIDSCFLTVLELSTACVYLPPAPKALALGRIISKLDTLKFFCQLAWENKLVATEKYIELAERLEEIGRMLGGWLKGLASVASAIPENKTLTGLR